MSCYYPNGDLSADGDIPCSTSGYGPCCPLNWECESNGLCYLANEGYYGRYTCTDETWQSSSCPQICTHDLTANGNEAVLECSSGSYCCDSNRPELSGGTACCEASTSRFSLAALPLLPPYNDGGSGGSEPSAASNSMPASASSSSTPPPPPPSSTPPPAPPSSTPPPAPPSSTPPPAPPSSTPVQISSTPPSSTPPSNTPTPTSTPLSSSIADFLTPSSTPQTFSTSISPTKFTSSSILSTAGSSNPSIKVVTQTVISDGSQSTIISSTASNVTEPASTVSTTKRSPIARDVGLGVCLPLAALALAFFFCYRSRKRSRRSTPTPGILQPDFIDTKPKSSASSPFPHTSSTAPPDSHRSSTFVGTQTQHLQSAELQGSPTAGTFRNSRGSEISRSAGTGASTSPRQSELPAMREVGGGSTNAAELPGATSPYKPYRPPGWS